MFTNESKEIEFVYHPSDSKVNWYRMIVNLIIWIITQTGNIVSMLMQAIEFIKARFQLIPKLSHIKMNGL